MTWGGMSGKGSRRPAANGGGPQQAGPQGAGPQGAGPQGAGPQGRDPRGHGRPGQDNAGWTLFSYLISGMVVYGGIGWLIARWTGHPLIFPVGMLTGLALAIAAIIYRYGRS
jgi:ATP synthase protein I